MVWRALAGLGGLGWFSRTTGEVFANLVQIHLGSL